MPSIPETGLLPGALAAMLMRCAGAPAASVKETWEFCNAAADERG
jgi:hypothetical protein